MRKNVELFDQLGGEGTTNWIENSEVVKRSQSKKKQEKICKKRTVDETKKATESSQYSRSFELSEVNEAIDSMKAGKAPGEDVVYPEFIRYLGKLARMWRIT